MVAWQPVQLLDVGFQLSVAATLAMARQRGGHSFLNPAFNPKPCGRPGLKGFDAPKAMGPGFRVLGNMQLDRQPGRVVETGFLRTRLGSLGEPPVTIEVLNPASGRVGSNCTGEGKSNEQREKT